MKVLCSHVDPDQLDCGNWQRLGSGLQPLDWLAHHDNETQIRDLTRNASRWDATSCKTMRCLRSQPDHSLTSDFCMRVVAGRMLWAAKASGPDSRQDLHLSSEYKISTQGFPKKRNVLSGQWPLPPHSLRLAERASVKSLPTERQPSSSSCQ